ncbi:MAG: class I SAM-dependent methyltransferase [Thermoguttaceae bacterium]|jgi:beta-galactosidase
MTARLASAIVLAILSVTPAGAVETVRVETSGGAPRLLVDGKPVRARIFWGAPAAGQLSIGPEAKRIAFEFCATEDEPSRATMHLRFGATPGDVYLDEVHVVDLEDNADVIPACDFEAGAESFQQRWTSWPTGPANTVGKAEVRPGCGRGDSAGLHIQLQAPPDDRWPDYHVYHLPNLSLHKGRRYRVSLWVRAEPARKLTVAFYRPGQPFTFLGGPPGPFVNQIKMAAEVGVDLVSFPVSRPWPRPGEEVDWTGVDLQCRTVLDANPKALLLPRIGMGAPDWWREAHPGDVMVWDRGPQQHADVAVASETFRRESAERLAALIEHLETNFGDHIAGYHPCGQNTGEWFYQETWGPALNGYSEASRKAWRQWLKNRYQNDKALQAAWRDHQVALDTVEVPSPAARRASPAGVLRDPVAERPLIDFAEFQQEMMADCVCHFARTVREATGGKRLVVFFYGYVFEFGAIHNGPATAGHYALRRVLDCPDIDVLCSPISYFDRGLGQSAPAMTAAESIALAGKMWLYEDDTRTYLGTGKAPGWQDGVDTLEETNMELLRNTAQCALRNFGAWWMDLGATGWFEDRRMWEQMERLKALDEPLLASPLPFQPEVAAVVDEPSMIRVAYGGDLVTRPGVYEARRPLGRMGAPYGQYLLDDVSAGRVGAKMFVFLNAWCLSPGERRQVLDATRGKLCVWCYAPGYQEPGGVNADAMRELTGFKLSRVSPEKAWAEPTESGKRLGMTAGFGVQTPVMPLVAAADATPEETLATYPDGAAAVALRQTDHGWSLFVGPPGLTSELLRLAARKAGIHLFTETDCNVYANGPYVVLHASQAGPLQIDTGRPDPVIDLLSGEQLGQGPKITLPLAFGETRVLVAGDRSGLDRKVQSVIDEVDKTCRDTTVYMIGAPKAKRLAELVRQKKPQLAVECGTAIGYSGLWIARELKAAGRGKLITIEIDAARSKQARENFHRAGLEDVVDARVGDARKLVREIQQPVDFLFIDCDYPNYYPCLAGIEDRLADGAVVVADNAGLGAAGMRDYLDHVRSRYRSKTEWFDIDLPWGNRDAMEITIIEKKGP